MTIQEIKEALMGKYLAIDPIGIVVDGESRRYFPIENVSIYPDETYVVVHAPESNKWHFRMSEIEELVKKFRSGNYRVLEKIDAYREYFKDKIFHIGVHSGSFSNIMEYSDGFQYILKADWCDPLLLDVKEIDKLMMENTLFREEGYIKVICKENGWVGTRGNAETTPFAVGDDPLPIEIDTRIYHRSERIPLNVAQLLEHFERAYDETTFNTKFKEYAKTIAEMHNSGTLEENGIEILNQLLTMIDESSYIKTDTMH